MLSNIADKTLALSKRFSSNRYAEMRMEYHARYDMLIPVDYLTQIVKITKKYRIHGTVYAATYAGTTLISLEPLPGARIQFYEVDIGLPWITSEALLGHIYTGPDGSYEFEFSFKYNPWIILMDKTPDIRARISQYDDGVWQEVYEGSVDWNISDDFHRDYFIPVEDTIPIPDSGIKPAEGFRYTSIGLLPIDHTRIVKGYATAQPGDPARIAALSHQPFCGKLRIFGLFAESTPVASYKVQIADADEDGPIGSWRDVTDPLHNRKWNSVTNQWDPMVLGPDPTTGHYQNIDTEPEADWHEHALKVTWKSFNEPNGYYALRIIGYDASSVEVGTFVMPVMRIDNDVPEASIEVLGSVTNCGHLTLAVNREIQFEVTAHDPAEHVLRYSISGTRGKSATPAGSVVQESRDTHSTDTWDGVKNKAVAFPVGPLTGLLLGCPSVAYNFELKVWGLATNCYHVTSSHPSSQYVEKEVNLVVAE
jgi:hypothetical protein